MAIRRQVKIQNNSISLARLLIEIIAYPQVISRNRYISLYNIKANPPFDEFERKRANRNFDLYAGELDHIDPKLVERDLRHLRDSTISIETYADRKIAHLDKRDISSLPTYRELDECIGIIEELTKKYFLILKATSLILPPIHQYDWKAIFNPDFECNHNQPRLNPFSWTEP